jgi:predicted anti-sigma-YlaC factor YlaD
MMNCDKAKVLLSDYIEGTLEPSIKKEIETFLESDPECKNLFEEAFSIHSKLSQLPPVMPSADFDSNLRSEIIKLNNQEKTPPLNKKGLSLVFSGTVLVAALYLFIFTDLGTQQNIQDGPMPSSAIGNPNTSINKEESKVDEFVETEEAELKSDSLKNIPEKINSDNIHLTGDK